MDAYWIIEKVKRLVRRCGTCDPFRAAEESGIWLYDLPPTERLLGMYTYRWRHRMIFLKPDMEEALARMVMAHELGHDQLHRHLAGGAALRDLGLFSAEDAANITEYEANAFAAHLLIDAEEAETLFRDGCDLYGAAARLRVNPNLLLIKCREMNRMGAQYRLPFKPDARFLRDAADRGTDF